MRGIFKRQVAEGRSSRRSGLLFRGLFVVVLKAFRKLLLKVEVFRTRSVSFMGLSFLSLSFLFSLVLCLRATILEPILAQS